MPNQEELLKAINEYFIKETLKPTSYTRAYFWWKKFQNISFIFQKELKTKIGLIKVIDIGCGLGSDIFYLNSNFEQKNNLEFYGVDLDPANIYCCNLKKETYQTKNITFNIGHAECLNLPNNSFDILLSTELLEHLEKPECAVNEFYRILKPGGLAIITTPNKSNLVLKPKELLRFLLSKLGKIEPDIPKQSENLNSTTIDINKVTHGHISMKGLSEWIRIFRECRFKIENIRRGSLLFGTPRQDRKRVIFASVLLAEILLDKLPLLRNLSENVVVSLRKT